MVSLIKREKVNRFSLWNQSNLVSLQYNGKKS